MIMARKSVRLILQALAGVVLLALASPAMAAGYPSPADGAADYRLGTGDKVRVTVFGETELGGEFQIDATGFVRLPMIGQVRAGGLTARDVESGIRTALADGYINDPRVSVEVTTYRPFYIVGEVLKPGEYPYANGMTASTAVAVAGGFTPKAIESAVYVRHLGENVEHKLAANDATPISPGDVIRVDSTTFWDVMDVLGPLAGVSALRYSVQ
jgi:protein involved in polysaccharide export with SLBB domain